MTKENFMDRFKREKEQKSKDRVKKKKYQDKHLDGIRIISCPNGIVEKDIDTYFERLHNYWNQATEDHELHVQVVQLLRAHEASTFSNAELTIVGQCSAFRFVSGRGRRKFWVELVPEKKVNGQVHVENLLLGFLRLVLCLAALMEAVSSLLSLSAVASQQEEGMNSEPMTVTLFTSGCDVVRMCVGCLAAFETTNTNSTLFSPPYGRGRAAAGGGGNVGTHGVGLWPVGRHRWFFRGLLYGVLASTSPLHVQHSEILPSALIQGGLVYSGWILTVASVLSVVTHVLHVFFPSLLKSPWASITTLPRPSGAAAKSSGVHDNDPTVSAGVGDTESCVVQEHLMADSGNAKDDAGDDSRRNGCCPLSSCLRRRPFTISPCLRSVSLFLCLATSLTLLSCHVLRLVHSIQQLTASTPGPGALGMRSQLASVFLCATVSVVLAAVFVRSVLVSDRLALTLDSRLPVVLHAATVSTLCSRAVVTWLTEDCGWSKEEVGVAMATGTTMSLLLPALLVLAQRLLKLRSSPRADWRSCLPACHRPREIPWEHVQRAMYMTAVLLSVCGMALAVLSLRLPVARVHTEYTDVLKETVESVAEVYSKVERHWIKLQKFMGVNICGGPDVKKLKEEMEHSVQAAAGLTLSQMRQHCDGQGWVQSVKSRDPFCERYGAARLYFAGEIAFNSSLHERKIRSVKSASEKVRNKYLDGVVQDSRAKQLSTLKHSEVRMTEGSYQVYEICVIGVCAAQIGALAAMLVPFVGIASKFVFLGLVALEAIIRLLIKLSKMQTVFLEFKVAVEIMMGKFRSNEEEKTIQFSFANFNVMYLAYPAILTGCVTILVGFWYRKGAPISHRRRASLLVLLPLVVLNGFGLGMTFAWAQIVNVLGEVAPQISMTVTPLSALLSLRASYVITLLSCFLFLLLVFLHHTHLRKADKQVLTGTVLEMAENFEKLDAPETAEEKVTTKTRTKDRKNENKAMKVTEDTDGEMAETGKMLDAPGTAEEKVTKKPRTKERKNEKKAVKVTRGENKTMKVTQGRGAQGTVWVLAVLMSLGSAGLVSVIIWKPVFVFDFDFVSDMQEILKRLEKGATDTIVARELLYDDEAGRCNLVDIFAWQYLTDYMDSLKFMVFNNFERLIVALQSKGKVSMSPALHLLQLPILLAVYLPAAVLVWGAIASKLRPNWSPSPRHCSRFCNSMAWLSLGWLTNGVLFLMTVAQSGAIPLFSIKVYTGEGLAFAMAANVGLILVSQELRIGTIAPVL